VTEVKKRFFNSIRRRILISFMLIVVFTVLMMEVFLIGIVSNNYFENLEETLTGQIHYSADIYLRYFSDTSLEENVLNNVDTFWKQTYAQVQIIDLKGNIIMDSIGITPTNIKDVNDVKQALEGTQGKWVGKVSYDDSKVMAISVPLHSKDGIEGVLRFIVSLKAVNKEIKDISIIFAGFGALFLGVMSVLSILMANTIARPLKEVTAVAERMAGGDYTARSKKEAEDEIGKLSDTLNHMAMEIVKKEDLKNDFISSVSHELRTPLTSIKGWAITLLHGSEDKEMLATGLGIIEKETDRLAGMVEELLDFSKFVSGKIKLVMKPTDMREVLTHVGQQMAPRAERDGIEFRMDIEERMPMTLSDENRLKQVFINLIDNGVKFTSRGGVVEFLARFDGEAFVISVIDSGCGISTEELPKVKEKFYKGKSSKSTNGIGLSICDEIIRMLDGEFHIHSVLDEGTEITVRLPLKELNR